MKCPACQSHNRSERRFCGQCGTALIRRCERCGFSNQLTDRFCGGCGEALGGVPESRTAPAAALVALPLAAPPAAPAPAPRTGPEMLSPQEIGELLRRPAGANPAALPSRLTQDDLDRLFGVKT